MKKLALLFLAAAALAGAASPPPKLILALAVDQFRYDYLTRFRADYHAGLSRLLTRGAVFTNAHYEHFPTVTAVGHSTFLTGATPAMSGIVGNDWFDRESGKNVTSVSDDSVKLLGGGGDATGSSPRRLLVSTVGDELKIAGGSKSKVIGISLKDRSAILPVGHMADGAYWFDAKSGNFVSSTYYFDKLPAWVRDFNATRPADRFKGATWGGRKYPDEIGVKLYESLPESPFSNELIEALAERAIKAEQLGARGVTDLLAVSFSANDYIGHDVGPDAPAVREISIETDKLLGKFFQFLETQMGMDNVLVVLTADHGVAPLPEINQARKMPGGRIRQGVVRDAVQAALTQKYGSGNWIQSPSEHSLYLNWALIREKKLDDADVERTAARAALALPHVFRVYTRDQLMKGAVENDQVGRRVQNGFFAKRAADVYILVEPYWMFSQHGTTHGSAFSYDAHVPVIFMGPGIKAGLYHAAVAVNDIAPTLATILGIETPSGSVGRVLSEILAADPK
jgi:predicted AlkP superfamily pyrophosphatase or phosphodiesterase